jgi:hypothetical protein
MWWKRATQNECGLPQPASMERRNEARRDHEHYRSTRRVPMSLLNRTDRSCNSPTRVTWPSSEVWFRKQPMMLPQVHSVR